MSMVTKQIAAIQLLRELYIRKVNKNRKIRKRKHWVKPLLLKRNEPNFEAHLLNDLLWNDDEKGFQNFTRISISEFEEMLGLVNERLTKADTVQRDAITPRTKLAITLRYLATGNSYKSLEFMSRVSKSTISLFVPDVLRAIYESLQPEYSKVPSTEEEWLDIADDFENLWQFPHTLGALDGKHIRIKAPANTGTQFYNFKGFYSIILFALVDAHGRFIYTDVGCNGKATDSTIYQDGHLFNGLKSGSLNIPNPTELISEQGNKIPYFFIGDDTFGLDKNLMTPYNRNMELTVPQEIFNYRLCRARMVVECAFGRLAKRFNIFHRPIEVLPSTVDLVVLACCTMHNYLTTTRRTVQPEAKENYALPETFYPIGPQTYNTYKHAYRIRDEVSRYCISDGDVDFQWHELQLHHDASTV